MCSKVRSSSCDYRLRKAPGSPTTPRSSLSCVSFYNRRAVSRLLHIKVSSVLVGALALMAAACGGSDTSSTATTPSVITGPTTSLFEGQLDPGGSAFYSFTVMSTGLANVMLASVTTSSAPGTSLPVVLGLALGTPLGTDCTIT